ncbi:hypothetical protein ACG7TL_009181 [Trametes sanguinea]
MRRRQMLEADAQSTSPLMGRCSSGQLPAGHSSYLWSESAFTGLVTSEGAEWAIVKGSPGSEADLSFDFGAGGGRFKDQTSYCITLMQVG